MVAGGKSLGEAAATLGVGKSVVFRAVREANARARPAQHLNGRAA